jgi:EpsI family protein
LNYTSWTKRLVAVFLAMAVPVVANGIRVYVTIVTSHLTDMRFGPGAEHVTFGKIFFIAVMLGMFWLGRRWHDAAPAQPRWLTAGVARSRTPLKVGRVTAPIAATVALALAPPYHAAFASTLATRAAASADVLRLPPAGRGWTGPDSEVRSWRPAYEPGLQEVHGRYADATRNVDVYAAVYGLGGSSGVEMVSYGNVLYEGERESVPQVTPRRVELPDGHSLDVREVRVPEGEFTWLVWHWYLVGDRPARNDYAVKLLEAMAWLTRGATLERVITLATPDDAGAQLRMQAFADAHGSCLLAGLAGEACAP